VIPFGLKVAYTIFVCALMPIYWREYGLANFLWFSDIALLALVPALWLENALLVSVLAVSVVFFEALWNVDFFFGLAIGKPLIGLSAYMFNLRIPLFIRGLSCFHIVLPLLLLWSLHRLGYDHRAFFWQTIVALVVLPLSYLVSDPQENVNWVYGLGENPQRILLRAAVCVSSNAVVPACGLSANAPSFRQNFSSRSIVILQCVDEIRHKMLSARTAHDFLGLAHGERIQTSAFFRDDGNGSLCRVWNYIVLHSSRSSR